MEAIIKHFDKSQEEADQVFNDAYEFAKSVNSIPTMNEYLEYKRFVESYSTGANVHDLCNYLLTIPSFITLSQTHPFKRVICGREIEKLKAKCYILIKNNIEKRLTK